MVAEAVMLRVGVGLTTTTYVVPVLHPNVLVPDTEYSVEVIGVSVITVVVAPVGDHE
jgi:hypothetical protein